MIAESFKIIVKGHYTNHIKYRPFVPGIHAGLIKLNLLRDLKSIFHTKYPNGFMYVKFDIAP